VRTKTSIDPAANPVMRDAGQPHCLFTGGIVNRISDQVTMRAAV
jgi:hypothetical protein